MKLPESLYPLFWEYDVTTIDTVRHTDVIICRIMERGTWAAMEWLLQNFSKSEIAGFLERKGKRLLPPRELNYWAMVCDLPSDKRHKWVKEARENRNEWRSRVAH